MARLRICKRQTFLSLVKKINMKIKLSTLPIVFGLLFSSCQKDVSDRVQNDEEIAVASSRQSDFINTFYGPEIHLGDGKVRSFIRITHDDVPQEIGIEITEGLFQNLPIEYADMHVPLHHKATEVTPYDHVEMDWMPNGHPPAYFQRPHFDIHFYMLPEEEQMAIPAPNATNTSLASTAAFGRPSQGVLPADYTVPSASITMMGRHWLDKFADVLPPSNQTFTHQFIYGTFDNKVVFLEPMVTRAFLLSGTEVHKAIKQPTIFDPTGTYYPTRYNIYTDETTGRIYVTLDEFVLR
jgi:uncharacterized protein